MSKRTNDLLSEINRSNTHTTTQPAQMSSIGENLELIIDYPDELPT